MSATKQTRAIGAARKAHHPGEPVSIVAMHADTMVVAHFRAALDWCIAADARCIVRYFSRCGIASVCATCRTVIWLTTRLLSHRRHPALFARFDEANSRLAFAFAYVSCGRCVHTRVQLVARASTSSTVISPPPVCTRPHVCESLRMSLVTPGVTPGFALTIPGYQHRPPCTTDREELHYALL